MDLDRELAYVERLEHGVEIGTRHQPHCIHPWDVPHPGPAASDRSLTHVEEACNVATIAVEHRYPWWLRVLWYVERSPSVRKWLRRLRLFRRRPYLFHDPVTHAGHTAICKWLCLITIHDSADVPAAAIAAERYLYDRGYQIVEKF